MKSPGGTPDDAWRREALFALALLVAASAVLHVAHVIGGHDRFSVFGPILAMVLSAAILQTLEVGRRVEWLGPYAVLVCVLVAPEWLEGELAAGHALAWATLEQHGHATIVVLALAVGAAVMWEASRLLTLIWRKH